MENEKQDYGKFQWFFFVVFIPIVFTITLVVVILSVAGFDVLGKTKTALQKVPVVENLFKEEKQVEPSDTDKQSALKEEENKELEKTIEEQTTMISALEKDVTIKEKEIQKLNQDINSLEKQLEDITTSQSENKTKDIGKLYDNMTSKKAAEIIPNLSQEDAMLILTSLDDKQVADILAKMPVEDAVKFTNLLATNGQ
ncbi:MotE family protein [Metabacillus litoralis]|uniref:MotE family protein n=1 Tax=Metabacillus litoralis TaxID=152268 RepID=UPI001CFE8C3E|nr:MotE family protein [Metabacillus litoralis]